MQQDSDEDDDGPDVGADDDDDNVSLLLARLQLAVFYLIFFLPESISSSYFALSLSPLLVVVRMVQGNANGECAVSVKPAFLKRTAGNAIFAWTRPDTVGRTS